MVHEQIDALTAELIDEIAAIGRKIKDAKPNDRSALDRRFAVALTKIEELTAWLYWSHVLTLIENPDRPEQTSRA